MDIYKVHLNRPVHDSRTGTFISHIEINGKPNQNFETPGMKFLDLIDGPDYIIVKVEFLPSAGSFYRLVYDIDERAKDELFNNSEKWFQRKANREAVNNLFKRSLYPPSNIPALPHMWFYVKKRDDKILCKFRDRKRRMDDIFSLTRGYEVKLQFTIEGVQLHRDYWHIRCIAHEIHVVNHMAPSLECLLRSETSEEVSDTE